MEKFESNFIKRVMKNIKEYDLLRPNDKVVIGVSGGADSTTLLDVIYKISTLYGYHFNIIVAHVNHQIRKGGAERDEEFVRNLAKKYDTEFVCRSVDVEKLASEKKISCEEAGREVPEHPLLCIPPESLSYEIDQGPIQDEHRSLQEGQVLQEGHE